MHPPCPSLVPVAPGPSNVMCLLTCCNGRVKPFVCVCVPASPLPAVENKPAGGFVWLGFQEPTPSIHPKGVGRWFCMSDSCDCLVFVTTTVAKGNHPPGVWTFTLFVVEGVGATCVYMCAGGWLDRLDGVWGQMFVKGMAAQPLGVTCLVHDTGLRMCAVLCICTVDPLACLHFTPIRTCVCVRSRVHGSGEPQSVWCVSVSPPIPQRLMCCCSAAPPPFLFLVLHATARHAPCIPSVSASHPNSPNHTSFAPADASCPHHPARSKPC